MLNINPLSTDFAGMIKTVLSISKRAVYIGNEDDAGCAALGLKILIKAIRLFRQDKFCIVDVRIELSLKCRKSLLLV
jgi:hypothetical protein